MKIVQIYFGYKRSIFSLTAWHKLLVLSLWSKNSGDLRSRREHVKRHIKYGLDHWTLGLFLDYFGIIFWTIFLAFSWPFFGPFYRWLVPRKGWDAVYQYWRRDGSQTVVTEGGVKDEVSICREGWEVHVLVTATDLWSVYCIIHIIFDFRVSLIFRHANAKLAPEHWTIIVIENIANSCFRSSTVKSCVCLLSRLVPVLNDTHRLAWIIFQLPHVSLFVCDEKSEEKEWCNYKWFHNTGFNPAVSETLLTYPSSKQ